MITRFAIVAILASISCLLPVELSIQNAVVRTALWLGLLAVCMMNNWIWKVGPSQWFILMQFISYGTWSAFYIVGFYFFRYTAYYSSVVLRDAELNAFQVDTGIFLFTCIAWSMVQLFGPKMPAISIEDKDGKQSFQPNTDPGTLIALLVLGVIGALALLLFQMVPSILSQPIRLLGMFFFSSVAMMALISNPNQPVFLRFRWPLGLTLVFGVLAFAGSGLKQMIFVTLLHLIWFTSSIFPKYRKHAFVAASALMIAFILLLPVFQNAKEAFLKSGSAQETFGVLFKGLAKYSESNNSLDDQEPTNMASMWRYLGTRVCLAVLPQIYHRNYKDYPQGYETFRVSLGSLVPRFLDPDKESIDEYFNNLARESGIGNKADRKTSRKPAFIDESIIVWGTAGFYFGGLLFGVYLILLERMLAFLARNSTEHVIVRFATLTLGQLPYSGVLIVALVYNMPFIGLVLLPTLRQVIDPNSKLVKFLSKRGARRRRLAT